MCSVVEQRVLGNVENYLNIDTFRKEKHAELVRQIFSETVLGYPDAPAPRPTRAHTFDFNCTYQGACLLDGECKASASNAEIAFMVLPFARTVSYPRCGYVHAHNLTPDVIL